MQVATPSLEAPAISWDSEIRRQVRNEDAGAIAVSEPTEVSEQVAGRRRGRRKKKQASEGRRHSFRVGLSAAVPVKLPPTH